MHDLPAKFQDDLKHGRHKPKILGYAFAKKTIL